MHVSSKDKSPTSPHWIILTFDKVFIPGDERSKTNPGHGYPERYDPIVNLQVFDTKDEMIAEIEKMESRVYGKPQYVAGLFTPATISSHIKVEVNVE